MLFKWRSDEYAERIATIMHPDDESQAACQRVDDRFDADNVAELAGED